MVYLTAIVKFFKNPRNRNLLIFVGIVAFCLLFLQQCNRAKDLESQLAKQKTEDTRILNNEIASHDTVHVLNINDSTHRSQILAYEITVKELNGKYSNLMSSFEKEKNKPPVVLIQTQIIIRDSLRDVEVISESIQGKDVLIIPNDTTFFTSDNFRIFSGKIPYKIVYMNKQDSSIANFDSLQIFSKFFPGKGSFDLQQNMTLSTGLFKDKKSGQVMIKIDTEYPGVKFTKIQGALIDSDESKKATREFRKPWSIGLQVGYGIQFNGPVATRGVNLGVGINYAPKFLQWGK